MYFIILNILLFKKNKEKKIKKTSNKINFKKKINLKFNLYIKKIKS